MKYSDGIRKYVPLWEDWEIDRVIGVGAFGKVYRIKKNLNTSTAYSAVKYITIPNREQYEEAMLSLGNNHSTMRSYFRDITKKVENEIELLYQLRGNSNIVSYEDHMIKERDDIGWDILIKMEYVTPLDKFIEANSLTKEQIIQLGIHICNGLELCHNIGIIHRDIKDSNIFISKTANLKESINFKIGDFGIATNLDSSGAAMSRVGTPYYMAPEIILNKESMYDKKVDIYSLGIVLYRLLNNLKFPFMPQNPELINLTNKEEAQARRIKGEKLPKPCNIDDRLWAIIQKACEYEPQNRYSSAKEFKEDLEKYLYSINEEERNKIIIKARGISTTNRYYTSKDEDNMPTTLINDENDETQSVVLDDSGFNESINKKNKNKKKIYIAASTIAICLCMMPLIGSAGGKLLGFNNNKPITPRVDEIKSSSDFVTGTADADATISILKDGIEISSGIVNSDGNFKIQIPRQEEDAQIVIVSENEKGYMSDEVTMMVVKGELLEINDIHDTDTIVEGRGEADNRISILKDGIEIGSTVIGSDGTFKAEIKPQENGTQLDIISKLKDGQISSKITVNVTSEKVVDKTSGSMEDIIQELESVVEQVEELKSQKDNNGRHIYEVNESKLKALKDNINSLKTGKDINLENIDLEIEVKEIDYGAES